MFLNKPSQTFPEWSHMRSVLYSKFLLYYDKFVCLFCVTWPQGGSILRSDTNLRNKCMLLSILSIGQYLEPLEAEASAILLLCYPQAKDRIQYYQLDEVFVFPYDMGSRWKNFKQVFTWSGVPEGDGLAWPVRKDCHPYSLTVSISVQIGFPFYLTLVSLSAP